jgi:nucleoside-diphosphate-sugar epimerase
LHLVIGAGEFLGDNVSRALAVEVPVIALHADSDDATLADAISGVEVIINCAQTWSPARRLRYRRTAPSLLRRVLDAARRAGVRRIVHISTADVYGPDHFARINERTRLKPVHAYERLKLNEERWLVNAAGDDVEVVVVRPARLFGVGEDWMMPRLMGSVVRGRVWLPGGGHATQTFIAATDVGRACLAASDRGRPGQSYLIGGFDSDWRSLVQSAGRVVGMQPDVMAVPYDIMYLRAMAVEAITPSGAVAWPGVYTVDALGKPHYYDDSWSRRELTWSPSVGSFEQEMPRMASWLANLPAVAAVLSTAETTSPRNP